MKSHRLPHHQVPSSEAPISVLIIEDDEEDYIQLHDSLCALGPTFFRIDWSRSFESGLTALTSHSYDVCLLDYQLGARNGLDFLHALSQHHKTTTAILMLTGVENPDVDKQAMQAGAMDYLVKSGLNGASIERSIRYALSHRLNQLALEDYSIELERKNKELAIARDDAMAAFRLKAEFLTNMSHETRTPLNGIIGLIHLLQDTTLTSDQRDALQTIEDCTDALLYMVTNILEFSRIEEGQLTLQHIDFDIRTTIEETITNLTPQAHRKNLELATIIHATVPNIVQGDPGRFRQILNNLLGNAIKFSDSGEIKIQVTVESESDGEVFVTLSVMDHGRGISDEQQQHLYDAFTQGDGSSKRKYPGAGLGLSVTKHLTELMGGTIGVDSTVGQGSHFWVTIPFKHQGQLLYESPKSVDENRELRVALMCADPDHQKFFEDHCWIWEVSLESWPTAEQGLQALQDAISRGSEFDVVMIDHAIPNMDGFTLAEQIKGDSALSHLPILMVSEGKRGEAKTAQEAGIAAYLSRPFAPWEIQECLRLIAQPAAKDQPCPPQTASRLITKHSIRDTQAREKTRILLVEDNTVNQTVIIRALEKLGHRVDVVPSGQEATTAVHRHAYQLVLFDEWLSEFDQTSMESLEERLDQSSIPMVLMTNAPPSGDHTVPLNKPVVATLAKPVKLEDLDEVITRWVGKQKQNEDNHRVLTP